MFLPVVALPLLTACSQKEDCIAAANSTDSNVRGATTMEPAPDGSSEGGVAGGSRASADPVTLGTAAVDALSKKQLEARLAEVMLTRDTHRQIVKQSSSVIRQALEASGEQQPPELASKLDFIVAEALPYDELLTINGTAYGKRFSRQEMASLLAFYSTPLGAKLLKAQQPIGKEVAERVQEVVSSRWSGLANKHGVSK